MKRSRRALWIVLATLAASLLAVDFSTRRGEVARRPPVAARNADKRSGARRRVVTGSLAALARDPSNSTGLQVVRRLNEPTWQGGVCFWLNDYVSLAADVRHSTGAELVARLNREQDNQYEPADHRRVRSGSDIAVRERLNAARMGWSGCSAYACGCDQLGGRSDGDQQAMRSSIRSL